MKNKIVSLVLIGVVALALLSGSELLVRPAYALALLLAMGYLWVRLNVRSMQASVVTLTERPQVGYWLEEEVTVRNAGILPRVLVEVQANADLPGQRDAVAVNLLPGRSFQWKTRTRCLARGNYSLAPLTVVSEDFLGFLRREDSLGKPRTLLVYPATLDLPDFPSVSGDGGGRQSSLWGDESPLNISGIRDYLPGDNPRHIHWLNSARMGRLMIKELKPDISKDAWIILDLNRKVQAGAGAESTEEYGITIAASIARKCIEANYSVGLVARGDQNYLFPAQKGGSSLWNLLEMLALAKARGITPLSQLVLEQTERFGANSTVVLITPSHANVGSDMLNHLRQKAGRTVAILLDPVSFGGAHTLPWAGPRVADDGVETYLVRRGDDIPRALSQRI